MRSRANAAAKMGINPLCDVSGTAGPTGCDSTQTAVFQLLDIPTRSKLCRVLMLSGRKKKLERPGSTVYEVQYHTFVWRWRCPSCEVLQLEDEMIDGEGFSSLQGTGLPKNLTLRHYVNKAQHTIALFISIETEGISSNYEAYLDSVVVREVVAVRSGGGVLQ